MAHCNYLAIFEFVMKPGYGRHIGNGLPNAQALCFVAPENHQYEALDDICRIFSESVAPYAFCHVRSCEPVGGLLP